MNSAYFAIGYKCNHRCLFCPREFSDFDETLPYDLLVKNVDDVIEKKKISHLIVSGGEPTMHPDFLKFMDYLMRRPISISLLTNGDNFSNRDFSDVFIKVVNPKKVQIITAIHSTDPAKHDWVTGSEGSYERSMNGLLYLRAAGYSIGIKYIVSKQNYRESKAFVKGILEKFSGNVGIQFCGIDCGGNANQYGELAAVSYQEAKPYLEEAFDFFIEYQKQHATCHLSVSEMPLCSVDPYYWKLFILKDPDRRIAYSAPNYKENDEHLSYDAGNDCDTFFEKCHACDVEKVCPGVWRKTAEILGEQSVKPILGRR
ncbi:MAG: radical SAM protein [bacterium]|nr:radical SAM protein [bacterium]